MMKEMQETKQIQDTNSAPRIRVAVQDIVDGVRCKAEYMKTKAKKSLSYQDECQDGKLVPKVL